MGEAAGERGPLPTHSPPRPPTHTHPPLVGPAEERASPWLPALNSQSRLHPPVKAVSIVANTESIS